MMWHLFAMLRSFCKNCCELLTVDVTRKHFSQEKHCRKNRLTRCNCHILSRLCKQGVSPSIVGVPSEIIYFHNILTSIHTLRVNRIGKLSRLKSMHRHPMKLLYMNGSKGRYEKCTYCKKLRNETYHINHPALP